MQVVKSLLPEKAFVFLLQFIQYVVVGGLAFVIDYAIFFAAYDIGLDYRVAVVIGFMGGLVTNYLLCVLWVWRGTQATTVRDMLVFALIGIIGLAITLGLMIVSVEWLKIDPVIAKILVAVLVLFWNFIMRRIFVFFR